MFAARGFDVAYGTDLVRPLTDDLGRYVVVTQPEPWAFVQPTLDHQPIDIVFAADLSPAHLDHLVLSIPSCDAVIGIGGGAAMDTAKWLHWRRDIPLYSVPSLPSVNACFTRMTALRDLGGVRYEGDAVPERVLVDFDLMRAAPIELLRGGIGDVLSCHTARFDWEYATSRGHDPAWDDGAAAMSLTYIDELEALAPDLHDATDIGLQRLMELHRDIGWRCHDLGHARFEEGSEHFFAYAFEEVAGRTIMHGELVTLGVLIMSTLQGNEPAKARRIVELSGMRSTPEQLGVSWDEIDSSLHRVPSFVREQCLWFSFANDLTVDSHTIDAVHRTLIDG